MSPTSSSTKTTLGHHDATHVDGDKDLSPSMGSWATSNASPVDRQGGSTMPHLVGSISIFYHLHYHIYVPSPYDVVN